MRLGLLCLAIRLHTRSVLNCTGAALEVLAEKEAEFKRWHYRKIEVPPEDLHIALPRLAQLGFRGLNLTIPHKVDVLPHLCSIDDRARAMGQSIP